MNDSFDSFVKQLIKQRTCDGQINDKGQIYDPGDIKQLGFLLGCELVEDEAKTPEKLEAFLLDLERVIFCEFTLCKDTALIKLCDKNKKTIFSSSLSQNILEVVDFETLANTKAIAEGYIQGIIALCCPEY